MNWFAPKPDPKKQFRQQKRELTKGERELNRERQKLQRQEKEIQNEIKKSMQRGDQKSARILAKQLVNNRNQQDKLLKTRATMSGVKHQTTTMQANQTMMGAMKTSAKAMEVSNKQMSIQQLQQTMHAFERENAKMEMTQEMLDDMFETDEFDDEVDEVVSKVIDEIGIDINNSLAKAPTQSLPSETEKMQEPVSVEKNATDDELLAKFAALGE